MLKLKQFLRKQRLKFRHGRYWYRQAIGGKWQEMGELQIEFLIARGLEPHHFLLDIGCGSLRGGIHFIRHLDTSHYFGFDKEACLIDAAHKELKLNSLEDKSPHLAIVDDFSVDGFGPPEFDYMIAQSVFTHLKPDFVEHCLTCVTPRLAQTGSFFATFNESNDDRIHDGAPHVWRRGEVGIQRYPVAWFEDVCDRIGCRVEYVGDWGHPGGQRMLRFHRSLQ